MQRVLFAALRLAVMYAAGVMVLILPMLLLTLGEPSPRSWFDAIELVTIPFLILFASAFVLLVVARRLGFAVLWLLLVGFWTLFLLVPHNAPREIPFIFVVWTALALPLFALGYLGTRETLATGNNLRMLSTCVFVLAVWVVVAAVGFSTLGIPPIRWWVPGWAAFLWIPVPYAVAAISTAAFWTGTRRAIG